MDINSIQIEKVDSVPLSRGNAGNAQSELRPLVARLFTELSSDPKPCKLTNGWATPEEANHFRSRLNGVIATTKLPMKVQQRGIQLFVSLKD